MTASSRDDWRSERAGAYEVTVPTAYGLPRSVRGHGGNPPSSPPSDRVVATAAACLSVVAWWRPSPAALAAVLGVLAAVMCLARARAATALALVGLLLVGAWRADHSWAQLAPDELGPYRGWVRVVDDPQPYGAATRVIVEVAGERYELWSRGRARQQRVRRWRAGEWVLVDGDRLALRADRAGRVAWQHVVGELRIRWASDVRAGDPVARASNRLRAAIERAAVRLPEADGALFRGLVVGDDRDQSREMLERFRGSGLSHLTAVSGQNVAFVLAAFAPLLRRLGAGARLVVTIALIGWFVALTRFEPSIVRAGAMAALSVTAFSTGRERSPIRLLALAVIALVLVDPLLVRSVGFQLSVGATAGVTVAGPWLAARLGWLGPLATPVGITLGAQLGVVLPSVVVFGRLPLMSVPANVLAVPVAGAVMLYGLPAGLIGGWLQPLAPVLMAPIRVGTRWIDWVATLAVRLEPPGAWPWVGWGVMVVIGAAVSVVAFARRSTAGKNRGPHDAPPVDRR